MSEEVSVTPGRPVRLVDAPPGLSPLILGVVLAGIAPLFGFLIGSMISPGDVGEVMSPIFWGLVIGLVIGGAGVAIALAGGVRLWRHFHPRQA